MAIGQIWDLIILDPMINVLIMLSSYLLDNFGLTIIVLTIVVNLLMYPLTQKQLQASKAMQTVQAQVAEIRKKYAKDKQKAAQEQMRLFKESGVSPAGCLLPMLIQMPVWIALYQSIIRVLAVVPEDFLNLSQRLYTSWAAVFPLVPLERSFLWLDLALPDLLLALLVGASMWVQQKMMTPTTTDPKQQAQSQMMLYMMPLMFAFFSLSFPSGLALYWVTSTGIRIAMQYFATGWGGLTLSATGRKVTQEKKIKGPTARQKAPLAEADISADIVVPSSAEEEGLNYGKSGDKRQDRGGSDSTRRRTTRRKPGGTRGYRRKGR
ncbi:MAG: membrane protein insertase YidC [Chloroflexi bacterium]|nr:membrane protein insertase YidC [Chloroflexota bacterium]MBI3040176.1 membrane protein insertase YidC [Chloroflexota bacterium]MBI3930793.1 membrane protein insertase YidC [Chloroflexota bacterium]